MHDADLILQTIAPDNLAYPAALNTCIAFRTAPILNAIGNLELLAQNAIALFCSIKCPGDLILKAYDLAQSLRDAEIPVISGFHTPIEQDCLKILLRGTQPIIHCPARSIHNLRLSSEQKQAVDENRLLLISPFSSSYPRVTAELAGKRNDMIGAIAHTIFIAYASPNSKMKCTPLSRQIWLGQLNFKALLDTGMNQNGNGNLIVGSAHPTYYLGACLTNQALGRLRYLCE